MSRNHLSIIVVGNEGGAEFAHTMNSVLRAAHALPDGTAHTITTLGESMASSDLAKIKGTICVVPVGSLISQNWLHAAADLISHSVQSAQDGPLLRPAIAIWHTTDGGVSIRDQSVVVDPLCHVLAPQYAPVVAIGDRTFRQALSQKPTDIPLVSWLGVGLAWLGHTHTVAPRTAAWIREGEGACCQTYGDYTSMDIFTFNHAAASPLTRPAAATATPVRSTASLSAAGRAYAIRAAKSTARRLGVTKTAKKILSKTGRTQPGQPSLRPLLPAWFITEWRELHRIDNRTFPSRYLIEHTPAESLPSYDMRLSAALYVELANQMGQATYDYILFAPWLVRGGADKFTISYANTAAAMGKRVLVITTLPRHSEWAGLLANGVDHCSFGEITEHIRPDIQFRLLETILAQAAPRAIHIINSELAYDFCKSHKGWLKQHGIKLAATSFSQEISPEGKTLGYSHTHVPEIYDYASYITSDNNAVTTMWQHDYGFDARKLAVHHLPHEQSITDIRATIRSRTPDDNQPFRVLWASRLAPEKIPQLVGEIGKIIQHDSITIDMYGTPSDNFDASAATQNLPTNVRYKGAFDGLSTLPLDTYDAFLYTSLFDGMPNTLLEIGLIGLPIVSSAVGGIPELIHDDTTGLLVHDVKNPLPYAEALRRLRKDPDLRNHLSDNLYAVIERTYSRQQFATSVRRMLEALGLPSSRK